jgi:hypothetical protein
LQPSLPGLPLGPGGHTTEHELEELDEQEFFLQPIFIFIKKFF